MVTCTYYPFLFYLLRKLKDFGNVMLELNTYT